jgi:hypothetical protein
VGNLWRLDRGPGFARNDDQVFTDLTVRANPSAVSRFCATSRSGIDCICPPRTFIDARKFRSGKMERGLSVSVG